MPDSDEVCLPGQCELLDKVTCQEIERQLELNLTYDLDGCFISRQLRDTLGYRHYKQVE